MSDKPSTATNESAKNPKGQAATMSGTTGSWSPHPMVPCHTENIDPNGSGTGKIFEKQ